MKISLISGQGKGKKLAFLLLSLVVLLTACGGKQSAGEHEGHGSGSNAAAPATASAEGETSHSEHTPEQSAAAGGSDSTNAHSGHGDAGDAEGTKVEWHYEPAEPAAGEEVSIHMTVQDEKGAQIKQFDVNHEKKMHLIVVKEDLSVFLHEHPELQADGTFVHKLKLPTGGSYKLFADFVPAGGSQMNVVSSLKVKGESVLAPITVDSSLLKEANGMEVSLALSSDKAGKPSELAFTFKEAKTGKEINDLEQYLGAVGHVVIISEDSERFLHVHPVDEKASGPIAKFATEFPQEGVYRIWGQFQRDGETFIVPFTVTIK
ncbi:hypothetical protein ACFQZE_12205 [Paenibacillus sp. GCM10027627]|uniref:hypothetical protein n=1 Tax=unclassified Paenibacillus TaxID=185978 RepID=UPI003634F549